MRRRRGWSFKVTIWRCVRQKDLNKFVTRFEFRCLCCRKIFFNLALSFFTASCAAMGKGGNFRNEAIAPTSQFRSNVSNVLKPINEIESNVAKKKQFLLGKSGAKGKPPDNKLKRRPKGDGLQKVQTKEDSGAIIALKKLEQHDNEESTSIKKQALDEHMDKLRFAKDNEKKTAATKCSLCIKMANCLFCPLLLLRGLLKWLAHVFSKTVVFVYAWVMWEFFGKVTHAVNKDQYMLEKYMDNRGELVAAFRMLSLSDEDKLRWVELWAQIDANDDNSMDKQEFLAYFELKVIDNVWTDRLFGIFNR